MHLLVDELEKLEEEFWGYKSGVFVGGKAKGYNILESSRVGKTELNKAQIMV